MTAKGRQSPRKPATKFPHLQKKLLKSKTLAVRAKKRQRLGPK